MKSSHNSLTINLKPLKAAYITGDRTAVLIEIKKLGLVKNEVGFYSAWWRHGKKKEKSSTIEYRKETLEYLKVFFNWYFANPSQTHFTEDMLNQAWDIFLMQAAQVDALQKWGHRNYPTPLELITGKNSENNMNGCFNKILIYLNNRQEAQKFTIEELFHLSLHAIQKLNQMEIKPKKLQEIIERTILWISDYSYSEENSFKALELSSYYRQVNPTTTIHEIIANKNPSYDGNGHIIPLVLTGPEDGRDFSDGYQLPVFVQNLLRFYDSNHKNTTDKGYSDNTGKTTKTVEINTDFIAKAAKQNGKIMPNTILANAHTLYTLILLEDDKKKMAHNYYRKNVIKFTGEAKEQSIMWYCQHLDLEEETYEKQVEFQGNLEEFRQAAQQYVDVQASKKRYKSTGPKLAKQEKDINALIDPGTKLYSTKHAAGQIWKEAGRIAKTDLSLLDVSDYNLYYYQGSGSRVHFIVHNDTDQKNSGFTHHMDHTKKLEQQIAEQRNELIRFGIALNRSQEIKAEKYDVITHQCKASI